MGIILEPYLSFNDGQCAAAIEFYQAAFGGTAEIMRKGDAPVLCDEAHKNHVMHCYFKSGNVNFMACDGMSDKPSVMGDNIHMSLNFTDEAEQTKIFEHLSTGGKITMPLGDTFWGARFGMLTDQFGIHWMFNCNKTHD